MAHLSLVYLMDQYPMVVPIPGATQLPHLDENIDAANVVLNDADRTVIGEALQHVQSARMHPGQGTS